MRHEDFPAFEAMLAALAETYSKRFGTEATKVHWRALEHLPIEAVRNAYEAHVRDTERGRWMPLPADVLHQIDRFAAGDGRPGADEAWAMMPRTERDTVVWTSEMAEAMNAAQPLLDEGDQVAARMAFREAYTRLVSEARNARRAVCWTPSLGWDVAGRAAALSEAVRLQRLSDTHAKALLPSGHLDQPAISAPIIPEVKALVRRLVGKVQE